MANDLTDFLDVLPYHPKPNPEESLCGYAWRLSKENGFGSLQRFLRFCTTQKKPDDHELITSMWRWFLPERARLFSHFAQLTDEALDGLTLLPLTRKFCRQFCANALSGVYRSKPQVCPLCLQAQPYLQRVWGFSAVSICTPHEVWLEDRCSGCGQELVINLKPQRYLCCERCGRPWADRPSRAVSAPTTLAAQRAYQAELTYLLRPEVELIKLMPVDAGQTNEAAPEGLSDVQQHYPHRLAEKFRHLQRMTGSSVETFAQTHALVSAAIYGILHGKQQRLAHYLAYLAALGYSWSEFSRLEVNTGASTKATVSSPSATKCAALVALCICPTEGCPNSTSPHPQEIRVREDWPGRQIAGFLCRTCGRTFMRHYSGALHYKDHGTVKRVVRAKSASHMATARRMGLEGTCDRDVDAHFRWEAGTAKTMWIKMGLLTQIRYAQAQMRHQKLNAELLTKTERFIQNLPQHQELITMKWVATQLGYSDSFLGQHRSLHTQLRNVVATHNTGVRHQRIQVQRTQFKQILSELQSGSALLTLKQVAQLLGCKVENLAPAFPDLFREYKCLRKLCRTQLHNTVTQKRIQQIDSAARRLGQRGNRLSKASILKEAGLNKGAITNPLIDQILCQWIHPHHP